MTRISDEVRGIGADVGLCYVPEMAFLTREKAERLAGKVAALEDEAETLRGLLSEACASAECGECCPFWVSDEVPCRLDGHAER